MNMSRPAISSPNEYESSAISSPNEMSRAISIMNMSRQLSLVLMNMSRPAISSPNEYESSSYL